QGDPEREEKRVGLKIARLKEAQDSPGQIGASPGEPDAKTVNDPLIDPIGDRSNKIVGANDGGLIQLVEIKAVAHRDRESAELFRQGITGCAGVKFESSDKTNGGRQQSSKRRERRMDKRKHNAPREGGGMGFRRAELISVKGFQANNSTNQTKDREDAQWPENYRGSLLAMLARFSTGRAIEDDKDEAEHIERCQGRDQHADGEKSPGSRVGGSGQDAILAEKSA